MVSEQETIAIRRLAQKAGAISAKYTLAFLRRFQRLKRPEHCARPRCGQEWKKQISGVRFCNDHYPLRGIDERE